MFKVVLFLVVVSQASASFFTALSSVGSHVGRLFSDVGHDLRDTYDCTVHVIEKAIYDESEISEYYNKCKGSSENNTSPSQKSGTATFTVLVKSMNSDSDANIDKKLDNVQEALKGQVANMSSQLDQELKTLSETVDQKFKRIQEEEKELAMEKSLQEFENKILLLEQKNNKESREEIVRVFEDMLKMLTSYTAQQDSELKNEIKVIVAACENSSSKTILQELEKWKEKVMQQIKDTSDYPEGRSPFKVYSRDIPSSFKEVFAKLSKNASTNLIPISDNIESTRRDAAATLIENEKSTENSYVEETNTSAMRSSEFTTLSSVPVEETTEPTSKLNDEQTLKQLSQEKIRLNETILQSIESTTSSLISDSTLLLEQPILASAITTSLQSTGITKTSKPVDSSTYSPSQLDTIMSLISVSNSEQSTEKQSDFNFSSTPKIDRADLTSIQPVGQTIEAHYKSNNVQATNDIISSASESSNEYTIDRSGELAMYSKQTASEPTNRLSTEQPVYLAMSSTNQPSNESTSDPLKDLATSNISESKRDSTSVLPEELMTTDLSKLTSESTSDPFEEVTTSHFSESISESTSGPLKELTASHFSESNSETTSDQPEEFTSNMSESKGGSTLDLPEELTTSHISESNSESTSKKPVELTTSHISELNSESTSNKPEELTTTDISESTSELTSDSPKELVTSPTSELNIEQLTDRQIKQLNSSTTANSDQATDAPRPIYMTSTLNYNELSVDQVVGSDSLSSISLPNNEQTVDLTKSNSNQPVELAMSTIDPYNGETTEQQEYLTTLSDCESNSEETTMEPVDITVLSTTESNIFYQLTDQPIELMTHFNFASNPDQTTNYSTLENEQTTYILMEFNPSSKPNNELSSNQVTELGSLPSSKPLSADKTNERMDLTTKMISETNDEDATNQTNEVTAGNIYDSNNIKTTNVYVDATSAYISENDTHTTGLVTVELSTTSIYGGTTDDPEEFSQSNSEAVTEKTIEPTTLFSSESNKEQTRNHTVESTTSFNSEANIEQKRNYYKERFSTLNIEHSRDSSERTVTSSSETHNEQLFNNVQELRSSIVEISNEQTTHHQPVESTMSSIHIPESQVADYLINSVSPTSLLKNERKLELAPSSKSSSPKFGKGKITGQSLESTSSLELRSGLEPQVQSTHFPAKLTTRASISTDLTREDEITKAKSTKTQTSVKQATEKKESNHVDLSSRQITDLPEIISTQPSFKKLTVSTQSNEEVYEDNVQPPLVNPDLSSEEFPSISNSYFDNFDDYSSVEQKAVDEEAEYPIEEDPIEENMNTREFLDDIFQNFDGAPSFFDFPS